MLDVEDPISGNYSLEISSPGLDRPLFTAEHFDRYIGEEVSVKMMVAQQGRKKFKGRLLAREEQSVRLEVDGNEVLLPMAEIDQARLVPRL